MKVYVAGPMTGFPAYNFPMFYAAAAAMHSLMGFAEVDICNPAAHDAEVADIAHMSPEEQGEYLLIWPEAFSLADAQAFDLNFIIHEAKAICLLPGWAKSTGARAEAHLALWLGHDFYLYSESPRRVLVLTRDEAKALLLDLPINAAAGYLDSTDQAAVPVSGNTQAEVRSTSSTGGQKGTKAARFDLIPSRPLRLLAEHYGRGALKYENHQWRKGYEFSKSFSAMQRHQWDWLDGKSYDVCENHPEECSYVDADQNLFTGAPTENGSTCFNHTGSHHMIAAAWHTFLLVEFEETFPEHDDRYKS